MSSSPKTVVVTDGNGFLGSAVVLHFLEHGYRVHTTVRSMAKTSPQVCFVNVTSSNAALQSATKVMTDPNARTAHLTEVRHTGLPPSAIIRSPPAAPLSPHPPCHGLCCRVTGQLERSDSGRPAGEVPPRRRLLRLQSAGRARSLGLRRGAQAALDAVHVLSSDVLRPCRLSSPGRRPSWAPRWASSTWRRSESPPASRCRAASSTSATSHKAFDWPSRSRWARAERFVLSAGGHTNESIAFAESGDASVLRELPTNYDASKARTLLGWKPHTKARPPPTCARI